MCCDFSLATDGPLQRCGVVQLINYSIIQTKGNISQYSQKWDKDVNLESEKWLDAVMIGIVTWAKGVTLVQTNSVIFWWSLEWDDRL